MFQLATLMMFSKRGIDIGRVEERQYQDRLAVMEEVRLFSFSA
jgi:hypothetical protein